ncbi:MAG: ABC transporter ATP-binding protein [Alicyclobacillus sp.]|nr:ABC transporter ATP-binding protein [Alicyclobacillus sp.]
MLEVENLHKEFVAKGGLVGRDRVHAVRGVSFAVPDGGALSFIGESGCGKTTIGRMVAGLEEPTSGVVRLDGVDVHRVPRRDRRDVLRRIQLIQQDPYQALNPAHTIEEALAAPLRMMAKRKGGQGRNWIRDRMEEVLRLVGLDPGAVLYKYPHMLSGGQRQRVVIARALTVEPKVLVADEAVSMIDVSLRLGILHLLRDLRERLGISLLFITHDVAASRYLGAGGQMCVIYRGSVVEQGQTEEIIRRPMHPYTQALLSSVPVLKGLERPGADRFIVAKEFSAEEERESGCLFAGRCPFVQPRCREETPALDGEGHRFACHFPQERQVTAVALDAGFGS